MVSIQVLLEWLVWPAVYLQLFPDMYSHVRILRLETLFTIDAGFAKIFSRVVLQLYIGEV